MAESTGIRSWITPMVETQYSPLSYGTIMNSLVEWRKSGSRNSEYNELDSPGHKFFKVVFHFWNGDSYGDNLSMQSGLIAPTWLDKPLTTNVNKDLEETDAEKRAEQQSETSTNFPDQASYNEEYKKIKEVWDANPEENKIYDPIGNLTGAYLPMWMHNSAYNFLVRNDELERAEKLKQFITLLSNLATYSPWYFIEIGGLDAAMERPWKHDATAYTIEPPKPITIKCMPDAADDRVGTLLDLYRDVAYSHIHHKEILPANLRKFDMSIYIFESPIENLHFTKKGAASLTTNILESDFRTSFKCFELHDCEIDYNCTKAGYTALNNTEGFAQVYEIPILVGNIYERRYNEWMDRTIGDMVAIDMIRCTYSKGGYLQNIFKDTPQQTNQTHMDSLRKRVYKYEIGDIDLFRTIDDLTGNYASDFINNQLLGNIYKASIGDITERLKKVGTSLRNGNLVGSVKNAELMVDEFKNGWTVKNLGNIHTRASGIYGDGKSTPDPTNRFNGIY